MHKHITISACMRTWRYTQGKITLIKAKKCVHSHSPTHIGVVKAEKPENKKRKRHRKKQRRKTKSAKRTLKSNRHTRESQTKAGGCQFPLLLPASAQAEGKSKKSSEQTQTNNADIHSNMTSLVLVAVIKTTTQKHKLLPSNPPCTTHTLGA